MQKIISLAIVALFVAAAIPNVQADRVETHSYIPGAIVTVIWCSADEHSIVPLGEPGDYSRNESDPLDPVWAAESWAWSGEPECAPHDVLNAYREANGEERTTGGYGGAAFTVTEAEKLGKLTANTDDDFFGVGQSWQYLVAYRDAIDPETGNTAREVSEGCGPQSITIPEDIEHHWQNSNDNPLFLAWDWIDPVGIDEDLTVCFSSTGMVTGTFSSV